MAKCNAAFCVTAAKFSIGTRFLISTSGETAEGHWQGLKYFDGSWPPL